MKKMRIEKSLLFPDPVEKVLTLKVTEGFTYKQEEDGIRTTGPLFIRGIYESDSEHKFQEILEMDVLAPQEKLSGESFYLEVGEFQGTPSEEGIDITIIMNIHGLIEDNEPKQMKKETIEIPQGPVPRHAIPQSSEPMPQSQTNEEPDSIEEPLQEQEEHGVIEDLFEDANNVYTSYRIIVAKPNDTYATIAQRYQVDEEELRSTNTNKNVEPKTLVVLPYNQSKES